MLVLHLTEFPPQQASRGAVAELHDAVLIDGQDAFGGVVEDSAESRFAVLECQLGFLRADRSSEAPKIRRAARPPRYQAKIVAAPLVAAVGPLDAIVDAQRSLRQPLVHGGQARPILVVHVAQSVDRHAQRLLLAVPQDLPRCCR